MFSSVRRFWLLSATAVLAGCSVPLAAPNPPLDTPMREISLALVVDPTLASDEFTSLVNRAGRFTSRELGVSLKVSRRTELSRATGVCLTMGGPSASLVRGWSRVPVPPIHPKQCDSQSTLPPVDIILVALASEGRFTDLLDSRFQGIAERVGGVGQRKNNLALVYLTGDPDFDTRVILHELGHLLGAGHTRGGFMIDDGVLLNLTTGYSAESRGEIRAALARQTTPFISPTPPIRFAAGEGRAPTALFRTEKEI